MNASDLRVRFLLTQQPEDGRKETRRAVHRRGNFKFVGLPLVGGHAMLLGTGAHDHRSPVRAAGGRHHAARMECESAFLHQAMQDRGVGVRNAYRAKPVAAEHDHVRHLAARGGRGAPDTQEDSQNEQEHRAVHY